MAHLILVPWQGTFKKKTLFLNSSSLDSQHWLELGLNLGSQPGTEEQEILLLVLTLCNCYSLRIISKIIKDFPNLLVFQECYPKTLHLDILKNSKSKKDNLALSLSFLLQAGQKHTPSTGEPPLLSILESRGENHLYLWRHRNMEECKPTALLHWVPLWQSILSPSPKNTSHLCRLFFLHPGSQNS